MSDTDDTLNEHDTRRRAFLKRGAKTAAAAPAVALLLAQATRPAQASVYGPISTVRPTDTE